MEGLRKDVSERASKKGRIEERSKGDQIGMNQDELSYKTVTGENGKNDFSTLSNNL